MGKVHRHVRPAMAGALVLVPALALTTAVPVPATAAASAKPWRVAYQHHYGAASNYSSYSAVVAPSKSDAWAFGTTNEDGSGNAAPVAVHWNGHAWRSSALPTGLHGVIGGASAAGPSNIWAVSALNQYALHWNGRRWTVAHRFTGGGELTGVTALSNSDVWVFGGGGFIGGDGTWHYNGRTWTELTGAAAGIERASALSARNIWGIGSADSPEDSLVHYNGTSWRRLSAPALRNAQFIGIAAISSTDVWAVGRGAGDASKAPGVAVNWNGKSWRKVSVPWRYQLGAVAGDGAGGIWVTASTFAAPDVTWVLHRSKSGAWTRVRVGAGEPAIFSLTRVPGTTAVWGAGTVAAKTAGSAAAVYAHGSVG
jgi:hypothetical protein